jgi:hypothetical protein
MATTPAATTRVSNPALSSIMLVSFLFHKSVYFFFFHALAFDFS